MAVLIKPSTGMRERNSSGDRKMALENRVSFILDLALRRAAQGLWLFSVAATTHPPFLVTRNNSWKAPAASSINSSVVTETALSKEFSGKGRRNRSPATTWK